MGKTRPVGSLVCDVFLCFVTFPYGVTGQVWYLIVSISDLCIVPYLLMSQTMPLLACSLIKLRVQNQCFGE